MNRRILLISAAGILCIALLAAAFVQRGRLADLRATQQRLLDPAAAPSDGQPSQVGATTPPADISPSTAAPAPSSELLRLRNQLSQLTQRQRELSAVRAENERLRAQFAARGSNASPATAVPPGLLRKSEAQWRGLNTPEDTLQSFLWTLQNRDLTNFLQVLTSEWSERLQREATPSQQQALFDKAAAITGILILNQKNLPDGRLEMEVQWLSAESGAPSNQERLFFRHIDGQWKLELH